MRAVHGLAPGLALDLACGAGRHALFLASLGWRVVAVDGSAAALDLLDETSRRRGLERFIEGRLADLESRPPGFRIGPAAYDLICDFYFLERELFEPVRAGVRPGGLFVAAIHVADPAGPPVGNPAFKVAPGELEALVRGWGWEILHASEGPARDHGHAQATAELVARRRDASTERGPTGGV